MGLSDFGAQGDLRAIDGDLGPERVKLSLIAKARSGRTGYLPAALEGRALHPVARSSNGARTEHSHKRKDIAARPLQGKVVICQTQISARSIGASNDLSGGQRLRKSRPMVRILGAANLLADRFSIAASSTVASRSECDKPASFAPRRRGISGRPDGEVGGSSPNLFGNKAVGEALQADHAPDHLSAPGLGRTMLAGREIWAFRWPDGSVR